ncbi:MAG: hypothetical protein RIQ93_311 [Verrucomicrobiota bacterium]
MPGPLGEVVPRRHTFVLPLGHATVRPGFLSRDLGGIGGSDGATWSSNNRLQARFDHSHALNEIFSPEDLRRNPTMAPMRNGQRFIPARGDGNWQPDLTSAAAIEHAATAANRAFAADPDRLSFSLSENDSARFDDSAATDAVVSPPRFFRQRPDYSDLIFGFTNAVAERVARVHPDRYLPAYAYYWAENAPRFSIAPNVIPWLTADRAQWFDPAFASEDQALIRRWTKSGARIVGAYDYVYGVPYLVPRPTLYAATRSIPFLYEAGVRAFFAETYPNWALDGPKPWITAQLLWSPEASADELLDNYYREFWAEAGPAMRNFFSLGEGAWLNQPKPGYWIKYYQDDHQLILFPSSLRTRLRAAIEEARRVASSRDVKDRIEFVSAGFAVSEAFAAWEDARNRLSLLATAPGTAADELIRSARDLASAREEFVARYTAVRANHPLALAAQNLEVYLRNNPAARAVRALARTGAKLSPEESFLPGAASPDELKALFAQVGEVLADSAWIGVKRRKIGGASDFEWLERGQAWQASGEPAEHRQIQWISAETKQVAGEQGSGSPSLISTSAPSGYLLRLSGCRQEFIAQWLPSRPGTLYVAEVKVRAKVSPGNQTFLIVNFLDEKQQRLGHGTIDRLPAGENRQEVDLCVVARAPANARYVGFGLRVVHQVNDDFAEFSGPSLRRLEIGAAAAAR